MCRKSPYKCKGSKVKLGSQLEPNTNSVQQHVWPNNTSRLDALCAYRRPFPRKPDIYEVHRRKRRVHVSFFFLFCYRHFYQLVKKYLETRTPSVCWKISLWSSKFIIAFCWKLSLYFFWHFRTQSGLKDDPQRFFIKPAQNLRVASSVSVTNQIKV